MIKKILLGLVAIIACVLVVGAFQADTTNGPSLDVLAPPTAGTSGTTQALQTVLDLKGTAALSSFSSHQRRLLELSNNVLHNLT